MSPPYAGKAVRLVVYPLENGGIPVAARAMSVVHSVRALLPADMEVFVNPRNMLHITVHFYSNPRVSRRYEGGRSCHCMLSSLVCN